MSFNQQRTNYFNDKWIVVAVLSISLLLRCALIFQGGQFYFSDEHRYQTSQEVAGLLLQGRLSGAFSHLFVVPEHLGFKVIGLIPAMIEYPVKPSLVIPALFFSLFSVFNLYLIFLLSQRAGAAMHESMLALAIAASSHSLLYYSRHLLPVDVAMTFGLLSLLCALRPRAAARTSLLCGASASLCLLTYNGYWVLAGFSMLCHVFAGEKKAIAILKRGVFVGIGFGILLIFTIMIASWAGINILAEYVRFAGSINQGDFSEGWSLPFEYFWHAEHFYIVILGAFSLPAILNLFRRDNQHPIWWLTGLLFMYGCFVLFSVYSHSFVVLGRLARQMMPFLILLAAHGLAQFVLQKPYPRHVTILVVSLIVIQGLWNYGSSFTLSYPREFSTEAQVRYKDFTFSPKRLSFGAPSLCQNNEYAMENAKYFLTAPETHPEIKGTVLMSQSHPVNFLPYQYEGYTPDQRQQFRGRKLRMTLYKLDRDVDLQNIQNCFTKE